MIKIQRSDQATLSAVLARAFQNDPVLRWIIHDDERYQRIGIPYFELILNHSLRFDNNYTNQEKTAVALWSNPGDEASLSQQLFSTVKLALLLRGNLTRAYQLQELMAGYRPRKDCLQLNYLATCPSRQGNGEGAALIKPLLTQAKEEGIAVYLECSNRDNLGFYRQFGFRLIDDIRLNNGPTIWPMSLEPAAVRIPL